MAEEKSWATKFMECYDPENPPSTKTLDWFFLAMTAPRLPEEEHLTEQEFRAQRMAFYRDWLKEQN